jgi:hypothetical protein
MAQVYSVNAVGYVNTTVPGNGFALISNPLNAADNSIDKLFAGLPNGTQVFVFAGGTYKVGTFDDLDNTYGTVGTTKIDPGMGVFVKNPGATPLTITFVGEVMQGTLTVPMIAGLQIVSSKVPQAGTAADLSFPHTAAAGLTNGDQLYRFVPADQKYAVSTFDDLDDNWAPAASFNVGEAVFVKLAKPVTWTRQFSVNQ